jgi:hypothetical protein
MRTHFASIALAPLGHEVVKSEVKRAALMDIAKLEGWSVDRKEIKSGGWTMFPPKLEQIRPGARLWSTRNAGAFRHVPTP